VMKLVLYSTFIKENEMISVIVGVISFLIGYFLGRSIQNDDIPEDLEQIMDHQENNWRNQP